MADRAAPAPRNHFLQNCRFPKHFSPRRLALPSPSWRATSKLEPSAPITKRSPGPLKFHTGATLNNSDNDSNRCSRAVPIVTYTSKEGHLCTGVGPGIGFRLQKHVYLEVAVSAALPYSADVLIICLRALEWTGRFTYAGSHSFCFACRDPCWIRGCGL